MRYWMPRLTSLVVSASWAMAATGQVAAQDRNQDPQGDVQAEAPNPYAQPNESWITIEGTVGSVRANAFTLTYAGEEITVEMDDADRDSDAYVLEEGDSVRVTGRVDDDLFESATIEASTVYVQDIGAYFYSSAMDEEDAYSDDGAWWMHHHGVVVLQPIDEPSTFIQGMVTEITSDEEFTIDRGTRQVTVDVGELENNPLDDEGYENIGVGDYVSVRGEMDDDLFDDRELEASSVIMLWDVGAADVN